MAKMNFSSLLLCLTGWMDLFEQGYTLPGTAFIDSCACSAFTEHLLFTGHCAGDQRAQMTVSLAPRSSLVGCGEGGGTSSQVLLQRQAQGLQDSRGSSF